MRFRLASWILAAAFAVLGHATAAEKADAAENTGRTEKGGTELWARNCRRCHNLRAPTSYSADQWEVVVNHMRVRAGLTAKDARKIEEFLKAAN